ncbi:MAG: SDR family NAD(P)-dependent oxidoreductase, partial [Alphaproteobacteria bacterium]
MSELSSIKGQVAVVSGGAAGIGLSCAKRFAAEGAKVAIIDRDQNLGEAGISSINNNDGEGIFVAGDCTSDTDMDNAVALIKEKWGQLDILVNCAGGFHSVPPLEDVDAAAWRAGIDWNLSGVYMPMRSAIPVMKNNKYGRIINIGSASGRTGAAIAAVDYSAAKAAVAGLSRRAAVELAPFGITVNTISPGTVMTPRIAVLHKERMAAIEASIPVGRL